MHLLKWLISINLDEIISDKIELYWSQIASTLLYLTSDWNTGFIDDEYIKLVIVCLKHI